MSYKIKKIEKEPYYLLTYNNEAIEDVRKYLQKFILLGFSKETIRTYSYGLLEIFRWLKIYGKELKEIQRSDLYEFIAFCKQKKNSPKTINSRLLICNCYYNFLFGKDIQRNSYSIDQKPYYKGSRSLINEMVHYKRKNLRHIKIKENRKIMEILNRAEVNYFIKSLSKYRDIAIVMLMILCGLRSKEVLELEASNVNLIESRMKVLGKGNKERILPLPNILLNVLEKYIKLERPQNTRSSKLFLILKGYKRGNQMTKEGLRGLFRYYRKITKLQKANAHKFRHSFGSEMAKEGMPMPILQKLMGHESIDITMKYLHLDDSDITEKYCNIMRKIESNYE